ncbi:TRAP transporter small permease [Halomonas binhaiensis]|uniref:TRAP transporter small permease protein n=1 Tax=Halomonas binhaiensis TaxID=2562282 RepID=A0A5C1NHU2_9GAMM|nr:TRAP transporter small permease [Halomonas binhaiensis]QEM82233.1 TRAP transporter small permease [Halomonas binhaiensis]
MSSLATTSKTAVTPLHHGLTRLCQVLALIGGALIVALAVMTVISILGRWLSSVGWISSSSALSWVSPVIGDYELVEMGTAIAVSLFLPYCHLRGGHVSVDLLVMHAPKRVQYLLTFIAEILFLLATGIMTWRLYHGLLDKQSYGETSMLLGIPLWWGYALGVIGMAMLTLVCLYRVAISLCPSADIDTTTSQGDA